MFKKTGGIKMVYEIKGATLPVAILKLNAGESVYTESGGMSWMEDCYTMDTNMKGGLLGGFKRSLSGESMFMVTYTCSRDNGMIAFSSSFPGSIIPLELAAGKSIICQKRSFLAAQTSVALEMHFRKQLGGGLFGGEGFILQKLSGPGTAFVEIDGSCIEYDLQSGQTLKVDTGNVAMFEETVTYNVEMVKGFKNMLFGGEGLFLTTLSGPGKVWLQTMPLNSFAAQLVPFMPKTN